MTRLARSDARVLLHLRLLLALAGLGLLLRQHAQRRKGDLPPFDRVLIETVGVGQSETDVAGVADTVVFWVQPGSGDSLQFMKAGIVEVYPIP